MAKTNQGRKWTTEANTLAFKADLTKDPWINLLIGVVMRAQLDAGGQTGDITAWHPKVREERRQEAQREAREWLEWITEVEVGASAPKLWPHRMRR